ncbi:hypothetical protein Kisp02_51820 [Kineosporia sp. NBRC 101731]|nr:hypothetical protein Kisp02_51820 [Kineosporia sp. NBRC 101731]
MAGLVRDALISVNALISVDSLISVTVVGYSPLTPDADRGTARDLVAARSGPERLLTVVIGGTPE